MADDIVERIRKNLPSIEWEQPLAAERERLAADEIERLRVDAARADAGVAWLTSRIGRLLVAGDALAKSLAEFHDPQDEMHLLAWQEARRG